MRFFNVGAATNRIVISRMGIISRMNHLACADKQMTHDTQYEYSKLAPHCLIVKVPQPYPCLQALEPHCYMCYSLIQIMSSVVPVIA